MSPVFPATLHHKETKVRSLVTVQLEPGAVRILRDDETLEWLASDLDSAWRAGDGSVLLQNGPWYLEVLEPSFAGAVEQSLGVRLFRRSFFDKIGVTGCLIALLVIILPLLAVYFWLAPFLAERAAKGISIETEQQIGESWYRSLTASYSIDTARTRQLQAFYDALQFGGPYTMRITVVQEPVVNAFAVPGGHIVVFDSILGIMDAPEQLAALLAHEASHIQLRHSTRAIFRELANQLFISILFGNSGDFSGIIAQHGSQLDGLSYSRQLEMEADEAGMQLLEKSGIPLRGMPDLFKKMEIASGRNDGDMVPSFLSTHPAIPERIAAAEKRISASATPERDSIPAAVMKIWYEAKF